MDADEDEFGDLYTDVLKPLPNNDNDYDYDNDNDDDNDDEDDDSLQLLLSGAPHRHPNSCTTASPQPEPGQTQDPTEPSKPPTSVPPPEPEIHVPGAEEARASTFDDAAIGSLHGDEGGDPVIPALSIGVIASGNVGGVAAYEVFAAREEDNWDSDESEDDIQIVLNDNRGPTGMPQGIGDDDGEDLVIIADVGPRIPGMDEQQRGLGAAEAGVDGNIKEGGGGAAGQGVARIGYSGHGYHPHHSQFKVSFLD